jgi:hypothetical protein
LAEFLFSSKELLSAYFHVCLLLQTSLVGKNPGYGVSMPLGLWRQAVNFFIDFSFPRGLVPGPFYQSFLLSLRH